MAAPAAPATKGAVHRIERMLSGVRAAPTDQSLRAVSGAAFCHRRSCRMKAQRGFTIVELIVTVLMLAALTFVAVPRLPFGSRQGRPAEIAAWKIVTGLRRTRSLAILHAATHPKGFALNIKTTGHGAEYEIVDLGSHTAIDRHVVDADVSISGRRKFEFSPLGALKEKNDPMFTVAAAGRTFTIQVTPSTGAVRCVEN